MRLPLVVAAAFLLQCAQASGDDHRYKKGEHVELWVNKVCVIVDHGVLVDAGADTSSDAGDDLDLDADERYLFLGWPLC